MKPLCSVFTLKSFLGRADRISTGCLIWRGAKNENGYGVVMSPYGSRLAHRVSFMLAYDEPVHDVCHKCDTPACIEPTHLFDGTQADNIRDALAKGRMRGFFTRRDVCMRGHDLTGANGYVPPGYTKRQCKTCKIIRQRGYRARG